jgi:hypothetical protein
MKIIEKILKFKETGMLILFIILTYLLLFYLDTDSSKTKIKEGFSNYKRQGPLNCYLFYTYNCPHSQKFLKTHWKNLNDKYSHKVVFNKIDCYHPNTKGICKNFKVKETPSILITVDMYDQNNNVDTKMVEFTGERTESNFENFLVEQISKYEREGFEDSNTTRTYKKININAPTSKTIVDNVEFSQTEDPITMKSQYCIKYKNPTSSQHDKCQSIDEKLTPNIKSWQGSYTLMNDFIKTNATTLEDKKNLADKIKNNLADWHLCDPDILNTLQKNIGVMENNTEDMDAIKAIQYGCGFSD